MPGNSGLKDRRMDGKIGDCKDGLTETHFSGIAESGSPEPTKKAGSQDVETGRLCLARTPYGPGRATLSLHLEPL